MDAIHNNNKKAFSLRYFYSSFPPECYKDYSWKSNRKKEFFIKVVTFFQQSKDLFGRKVKLFK